MLKPTIFLMMLTWFVAAVALPAVADDKATKNSETDTVTSNKEAAGTDDAGSDPMLKEMLRRMQDTKVRVIDRNGNETVAALHPKPVFRYSDQPRFFYDATLWVWTVDGLPVAMQKIEVTDFESGVQGKPKIPKWVHCFTSLSTDIVKCDWPDKSFEAKTPGVEYVPISKAPVPATTGNQRKLQIRQLSRRFSAEARRNKSTVTAMRVMPRPIFEFSDSSEMPIGAVFGLEANGTNPDMMLIIAADADADGTLVWKFGINRMTDTGAIIKLDETEVHLVETVPSQNTNVFDNWMFFFADRAILTIDEQKARGK